MAHSDPISENFINKLLFLQAYLIYSETTIATTTQVLSPRLSIPTPLILELLNITIHYLAIQHNNSSILPTAPITEQQYNSSHIPPSFTLCSTLTLSLTNTMNFDSAKRIFPVSISKSIASISIASTNATMAIMNSDLKYAKKKYSFYKLQELKS